MPRVVGVTACANLTDYFQSARRAGGLPRCLEWVGARPNDAIAEVDGLMLTGGPDVDPALWGGRLHPTMHLAKPGRDAYEIAMVRLAVERDLPVLAICRGLQVLNVALGGTLVDDIPSRIGGALAHALREPADALAHKVSVTRDSLLGHVLARRLAGGATVQVNSRHHQSVQDVAPGLVISSTAPDGVVEAVEHPDRSFCVGVQWHPENFWRTGDFSTLFEAFCAACGRRPT